MEVLFAEGLFQKVLILIGIQVAAASVSAWVFRNFFGWFWLILTTIISIGLIFAVHFTKNSVSTEVLIGILMFFGASVGATLGSYSIMVTDSAGLDSKRAREAVGVTFLSTAIAMLVAAGIGMVEGLDIQWLAPWMFWILVGIILVSILFLFVKIGKFWELVFGGGVAAFFFVYMLVWFNKIQYTADTWQNAAGISMSIFLDLVNIFIRLLPIIAEVMSK